MVLAGTQKTHFRHRVSDRSQFSPPANEKKALGCGNQSEAKLGVILDEEECDLIGHRVSLLADQMK